MYESIVKTVIHKKIYIFFNGPNNAANFFYKSAPNISKHANTHCIRTHAYIRNSSVKVLMFSVEKEERNKCFLTEYYSDKSFVLT